ncbi:hypothetical protein [Burkholderia phage FLC9]|nr:hypothetical protein [Burkholderia phage FLC9]
MLSKRAKSRIAYKRYCRIKSRRKGRRMAIKACDWIWRDWIMSEPVGPFRDIAEFHEMLFHQANYLTQFRRRTRHYVTTVVVWHQRHSFINNGMSSYELMLEFKRFLTQDLNVRICQTYDF